MSETIPPLSDLRAICWDVWDPIGLGGHPADEYDSYLLELARLIRDGADDTECVDFLVMSETDTIGLRARHDTHTRAVQTVAQIRALFV